MNNTIEKFTQSLDRSIKKLQNDLTKAILNKTIKPSSLEYYTKKDLISQRRNIKRIINIPKELWKEHNEIYVSFDELSSVLSESGLKTREKVEIIILIFEKNLTTIPFEKDIDAFENPTLANYPFKYTTFEEATELIYKNKYKKLYENKENLSPLEQLKLEEIKKAVERPLNLPNIIKQHILIKKHYFDKYPNLNKEDVNFIIEILKEFNLTPTLLKEVKAYFYSFLEKKDKKSKQEKATNNHKTNHTNTLKSISTPKVSEKEFNALNRKLKSYYDLNNNTAIRPLSLEEQIICVNLLQRMDISKKRINEILRKINKLSSKHPISLYIRLYNKFNYYKDNIEIASVLNELEKYFNNIFICDDEYYEILKMCFEDELNKILQLIPKTYDYEYEKAKEITLSKKI